MDVSSSSAGQPAAGASAALAAWATESTDAPVSPAETRAFSRSFAALGDHGDSTYAECRLGNTRQLDLLICYGPASANLAHLRRLCGGRLRAPQPAGHEAWSVADSFVRRWADDDAMRRTVSAIWLEFDDVMRPPELAAPSLSACIAPNYGRDWHDALTSRTLLREAVLRTCAALEPNARPEVAERLEAALGLLPQGGRYIHVSVMAARSPSALKLYGVCPASKLLPYLEQVGLSNGVGSIGDFMDACAPETLIGEDVYFDLNVSALAGPATTFGLAFSQQNRLATAPTDVGRRSVLDRLVACGLCAPGQANALAEWTERPSAEERADARRWLDLKAVFDGSDWSLKAYLGFAQLRSPFAFFPRQTRAPRAQAGRLGVESRP